MNRLARPPYIDTTTGIAYDTDKAEFEGYLTKQSMWLRVRIIFVLLLSVCLSPLLRIIVLTTFTFGFVGLEKKVFHSQGISIIFRQDTL